MLQYFLPVAAVLSHGIGSVLAHADSMAVAGDGKGEHPVALSHVEAGGAKGKQAEVTDQQTTELPAENGETENQSAASEEEKETKSD